MKRTALTKLIIQIDLDGPRTIAAPDVQPAGDAHIALSMGAPKSEAFRWLADASRLPAALLLDTPFSGTQILLDSATGLAEHRPAQPAKATFLWQDRFDGDTLIGPEQALQAEALVFDQKDYAFVARPRSGALFLHADVLDTAPDDSAANEMLFQYAAANGEMVARGTSGVPASQLVWRGGSGQQPALLMFRHQDEHGAPLIFLPDGEMPLVERTGVATALTPNSGLAKQWNQTNRAMVIGTKAIVGTATIGGTLASLDIEALYDVMSDPGQARNHFAAPWFVQNGAVPVVMASPREIHNVAMNSWLSATATKSTALRATLEIAPHAQDALTVFHTTTLKFDNAADWTLKSLRPERDLKPDAAGKQSPYAVGAYQSAGVAGAPVELPAIDYAYAVANLAGARRTTVKGGGTGALTALVKKQLDGFDGQFAGDTPKAFAKPDIPVQRHLDGAGVGAEPRGYPHHAVTAQPWNLATNAPLAMHFWPRGKTILPSVFRPEWQGGTCLYLPCDRISMNGHEVWVNQHPNRLWQPARGIICYLGQVHDLLNQDDYKGAATA